MQNRRFWHLLILVSSLVFLLLSMGSNTLAAPPENPNRPNNFAGVFNSDDLSGNRIDGPDAHYHLVMFLGGGKKTPPKVHQKTLDSLLKKVEEAIRKNPKNPTNYHTKGKILIQKKQSDEAMTALLKGLEFLLTTPKNSRGVGWPNESDFLTVLQKAHKLQASLKIQVDTANKEIATLKEELKKASSDLQKARKQTQKLKKDVIAAVTDRDNFKERLVRAEERARSQAAYTALDRKEVPLYRRALLVMEVPENAKLYINNKLHSVAHPAMRQFITPMLQADQPQTYSIKAEFTRNGQKLIRQRTVKVRAGEECKVSLLSGSDSNVTTSSLLRRSLIIAKVPKGAVLYVNDARHPVTSKSIRDIITSPLEPGRQYSYTLQVRRGRSVIATRQISVVAGNSLFVSFDDS